MPLDELCGSKMETQLWPNGVCRRSPSSPPRMLRGNVVQISAAPKFTSTFMRCAVTDCYCGTAVSEWASETAARKLHIVWCQVFTSAWVNMSRNEWLETLEGTWGLPFNFLTCVEMCWLCFPLFLIYTFIQPFNDLTFHCYPFLFFKITIFTHLFAVQSHLFACLC